MEFDIPTGSVGDCYDRYLVRMEEMRQSMRILYQCLAKNPRRREQRIERTGQRRRWKNHFAAETECDDEDEELIHQFMIVTEGVNCPPGEVYFGHENPKGELGFYINSKGGGVPYRLKIRSPSFINLSILGELMPGAMISDVPVILGSIDFVMGESDR